MLTAQITDQTTGRTTYNGPLAALHSIDAGTLAAGAGHVFRLSVTMDNATPSIAYERASSTVGYTWTADGVPTTPPGVGGRGGGGGTPPDTRRPTVRIAAKATQRAKLAFVTARCDEPCRFRVKAKVSGAKGAKSPKASRRAGVAAAGAPTKINFVFDDYNHGAVVTQADAVPFPHTNYGATGSPGSRSIPPGTAPPYLHNMDFKHSP